MELGGKETKRQKLDKDGPEHHDTCPEADENNLQSFESKSDPSNSQTLSTQAKGDCHNRCKFYIEKKKRCCKTQPPKGQQYCVEHAHNLGQSTTKKRVTCPLDPKHSCYEDQLQKHLKKCNARPELQPPYFTKDINTGEEEGEDPAQYKIGLKDVSDEDIFKIIEQIKQKHKEKVGELRCDIQFHWVMQEEADKPSNGLAAQKHIQQQASLIGHMERLQMLGSNTSFVEFGAGKGGLSHWVQLAAQDKANTQFMLVDKGSVRYKMDTFHKGVDQGPSFERIKIDIADLDLGKVKSLCERDSNVVGLGKHLCGGATDLMLRCLVETFVKSKNERKSNLQGIVLALCCHHRCDWKTYVGKDFIRELGFTARDFQVLTRLTSWAVCGTRPAKGNRDKKTDSSEAASNSDGEDDTKEVESHRKEYNHPRYGNMLPEERAAIGYQCKQLIDAGRQHYLQSHGFEAEIVYYTERERTLENMALLATHCKEKTHIAHKSIYS